MNKIKCQKCKKYIAGNAKVDTYRRKLGNKSINQVDYYCEKCFYKLNEEKARNEYDAEETARKRKNNR